MRYRNKTEKAVIINHRMRSELFWHECVGNEKEALSVRRRLHRVGLVGWFYRLMG